MTLPADPISSVDEFAIVLDELHRPGVSDNAAEAQKLVNIVDALTPDDARRALVAYAIVAADGWKPVRDAINALRELHERGAAG